MKRTRTIHGLVAGMIVLAFILMTDKYVSAQYVGTVGTGNSVGFGIGFGRGGISIQPIINLGSGSYYNNMPYSQSRSSVTPFYAPRTYSSRQNSMAGTTAQTSDRLRGSRRVLDERLYELGNTTNTPNDPSGTLSLIERAMTTAPANEIRAGTTLNQLTEFIADSAINPPAVALPPDLPTRLNYSTKNVDGQSSQIGLLRNLGVFEWPAAYTQILTIEARAEIEQAMQQASTQVRAGKLDPDVKALLEKSAKRMDGTLRLRVQDIVATDFFDARKFLREFEATVNGLNSADVGKLLRNPTDWKKITTVFEMVKFMTLNDIRFAQSPLGNEAAYDQMYQILVDYVKVAGISPLPKNTFMTPKIPMPIPQ